MASKQHTLRIAIAQPKRDRNNDDFVLLEQEPWDPYIGFLTKFGVYAFINSILFNEDEPEDNCPPSILSRSVYAYPSREDLNYRIGCSWGSLSARRVEVIDYTEDVQVDIELELDLKYPAVSITRSSWVGDVYTADGEVINPTPQAIVTTDGVSLTEKVYGTLLVTYKVCRHVYGIRINPRVGAIENQLQSFVYACWDGGNTYMEMEIPDGSEDGGCNYKIDYNLHMPDSDDPPDHVDPENEYLDIDYCTGLEAI